MFGPVVSDFYTYVLGYRHPTLLIWHIHMYAMYVCMYVYVSIYYICISRSNESSRSVLSLSRVRNRTEGGET